MLHLFLTSDTAVMLAGVAALAGYCCGMALMALVLWPHLHRNRQSCERLLRLALEDRDRRIAELERAA